LFEVYVASIVSITEIALSAFKSKRFFKILDSFYRFDKFTLQMRCPSNYKSQKFYLVFILLIGTYHFSILTLLINDKLFILFIWTLCRWLTMISTSQYIICIQMLSDRYKLANILFENSKYLSIQIFKCNIIYRFICKNDDHSKYPQSFNPKALNLTYNCIILT